MNGGFHRKLCFHRTNDSFHRKNNRFHLWMDVFRRKIVVFTYAWRLSQERLLFSYKNSGFHLWITSFIGKMIVFEKMWVFTLMTVFIGKNGGFHLWNTIFIWKLKNMGFTYKWRFSYEKLWLSPMNRGFHRKITFKWSIFHCWKMNHWSVIFLIKPRFRGDFPWACLITRG